MEPRKQALALLKEAGAKLLRHRKHEVWRLPNGRNWIRSSTPSDTRGDRNNLSDLRRALGPQPASESPASNDGPRRSYRKPGASGDGKRVRIATMGDSPLATALRVSGILEKTLREEIADLEHIVEHLRSTNVALRAAMGRCWLCRLRLWRRGGSDGR